MTLRPDKALRSFPAAVCVSFLCLMASLAAACSVDIGKLRAPTSRTLDGSMDHPILSDATEVGSGDTGNSGGSFDADSASVLPDLPAANEVAVPHDATDLPEMDAAEDVVAAADVAESPDLSTTNNDTSEAGIDDGGGTGGVGGTGSGGTGSGGTGSGGTGGTGGADPDLVLWYKFDESSGATASDSSMSVTGTHDGALAAYGTGGRAAFSTDGQVGTHALSLMPSPSDPSSGGGYVTVPAVQPLAPNALTIAVWVKLAAATTTQNWERIFDFGTNTSSTTGPYCYLTARSNSTDTPVRFGISPSGRTTNMQRLEGMSALTVNVWHHIAIVLPAGSSYTGTMYIDGVVAATNNAMTLHLSDLATTTDNYLGRSQFSGSAGSDPFFYGALDDFRVYKRALSQQEISALFALR